MRIVGGLWEEQVSWAGYIYAVRPRDTLNL